MNRLVTIPFSHYCERARWGLDRFDVPYRELGYLPLFHLWGVGRAAGFSGRKDKVSTRFSTPVLVTDNGDKICDSAQILRWASDSHGDAETTLFPEGLRDEIESLERRFHDSLAPHARRLAYHLAFGSPGAMAQLARENVGSTQAALLRLVYPLWTRTMRRALKIDDESADRSLDKTRRELDDVESRIADGRPYLLGDRFTAADIAFACGAAPGVLVMPEEGYGAKLPDLESLDESTQALVAEMRGRPAGRFALRLFAEERRGRAAQA